MAYTKTTWQDGITPVNAENLNKIENEIEALDSSVGTPIATYTHTANKEVTVSAVDINTDTFTSIGHGLNNGDKLYPIINFTSGNVYPPDKYVGGVSYRPDGYTFYYIGVIDADHFKLYSDSGRTTVVDLVANANMDLTKWHFEKFNSDPVITNLPARDKYKLIINGRNLYKQAYAYILPNNLGNAGEWLTPSLGYPILGLYGDISIDAEIIIDYKKYLTIKVSGVGIYSNNASSNSQNAVTNRIIKDPNYVGGTITSIAFSAWGMANGTTVEVYKV
jgi:hypothetical protein